MLLVCEVTLTFFSYHHHLSSRLQYLCLLILLVTSTSYLQKIPSRDHASRNKVNHKSQRSHLSQSSVTLAGKGCSRSSRIALYPQNKSWVVNVKANDRAESTGLCGRDAGVREMRRRMIPNNALKNKMSSSRDADNNELRNGRSHEGDTYNDVDDDGTSLSAPIRHIAYIVDGNGRWALRNNKTRIEGHNLGANVTVEIVKKSFDLGIEVVTLYLFSTENWKRSNEEIMNIMFLLEKYLRDFSIYLKEKNIRIRVIGQKHRLSESVQLLLNVLETSQLFNNDAGSENQRTLCLAVSYGGRDDIVEATKIIAELVKSKKIEIADITEKTFSQYTMTGKFSCFSVLTSISGFLLIFCILLYSFYFMFCYHNVMIIDALSKWNYLLSFNGSKHLTLLQLISI